MKKVRIILTTAAIVSAVGGMVASAYNVVATNALTLPAGQGYVTKVSQEGFLYCMYKKECGGGSFVCRTSGSSASTLRSSSNFSSAKCGVTLGRAF